MKAPLELKKVMIDLAPLLLCLSLNSCQAFSSFNDALVRRSKTIVPTVPRERWSILSKLWNHANILEEDGFTVEKNHDSMYATFLDQMALRQAMQNSSFFSETPALDAERIVQSCTIVSDIPGGSEIFAKGDVADGLYFCRSGNFEAVLEGSNVTTQGTTILPLAPGDIFGELGLFFDRPRGATVRAAVDSETSNSLWKLNRELVKAIMVGDQLFLPSLQAKEGYKEYLDAVKLEGMVQQCPIFKELVPEDRERVVKSMTEVSIAQGTNVITQGEEGSGMYFVESGTFECFDEKTGKVVKVLQEGDYFGELALLFNQPRAVSVRATASDCRVWVLPVDKFDDAIEASGLAGLTLEYLKQKYQKKNMWRSLLQNPEELYSLAKQASRPKKKKVSFHSTMTGLAAGALIPILLPFWKPRWNGILGFPQIVEVLSPTANAVQLRYGTALLVLSGLLGLLRFPRNTPRSRAHVFATLTSGMIMYLVTAFSNCLGNSWYLLDAWSGLGRTVIGASVLALMGLTAQGMHLMVAGPKDAGTLRQMNPMFENRAISSFSMWAFVGGVFALLAPMAVVFESKERFTQVALPLFVETGFSNYLQFFRFAACAYYGLGALYATLQYEKRLKPRTSMVLLFLTLVLTGNAEGVQFFFCMGRNEQFLPLFKHIQSILQRYHLGKCYFGFFAITFFGSLFQALWLKRKGKWEP